MKNLVVIPAYKPDEALISLAQRVRELGYELLTVDDGSGEAYEEIFEKVSRWGKVLRHEENRGKGAAIKTALACIEKEAADTDGVGIMDADGQHLPEDMARLFEEVLKHEMSLVLGVRNVGKDMPFRSRAGNGITRMIFRLVTGVAVSDTQTGLRAFDSGLIGRMGEIPGERYEYETNVLLALAKEKVPIVEVKIKTIYRDAENSSSHFHVIRDSFLIYKNILKFTLASLSSFLLDFVLFTIGTKLLAGIPYGVQYSNVLARLISGYYNYHMNTSHVFHRKKSVKTAGGYAALAVGILICNSLVLELYRKVFSLSPYPAKLLTEITLFLVSYGVQNRIIFSEKPLQRGRDQ